MLCKQQVVDTVTQRSNQFPSHDCIKRTTSLSVEEIDGGLIDQMNMLFIAALLTILSCTYYAVARYLVPGTIDWSNTKNGAKTNVASGRGNEISRFTFAVDSRESSLACTTRK